MDINQIKPNQVFYHKIKGNSISFFKLNKPIESSLNCDKCKCKNDVVWNASNFTNNVHFCINNVDYDLEPTNFYIKDNNPAKTEPLYKKLACLFGAMKNCQTKINDDSNTLMIIKNADDWLYTHNSNVEKLVKNCFYSGSGLDYDWYWDIDNIKDNQLIFSTSYHQMDEYGGYVKVIDFSVTITPNLQCEFDLYIKGNFGKYQATKDYLYDILNEMFYRNVNRKTLEPINEIF